MFNLNGTILLTGIGGSIGAHTFAHIMHNTQCTVVGIDSFRHKGLTDRINVMLEAHPEWRERLRIITHDLTAPISDIMAEKIGPINYIINMASLSDVQASIDDPGPFIQNNIALTTNMLDYARLLLEKNNKGLADVWYTPAGMMRGCLLAFIQISTDEVYGPSGVDQAHAEWSPILPSNPYAASKAAQEAIAISYWRSYGIPLIITNTMNNFGELQQPNKFPAMVQRKVMNGETVSIHGTEKSIGSRYYIHSRNHADALLYILSNTTPYLHHDGQIDMPDRYNIVGDKRINNLELAQTIASQLGKELKYALVDFHAARPGHDRHYGLDGRKLAALGWTSPAPFEESLRKTLEWTQEHPEWNK